MLRKQQLRALADELLPGFGFFGGTEDFALQLDINSRIDGVRIAIEADHPEFLNLGTIKFHGVNGTELDRKTLIRSAALSSVYGTVSPEEVLERVLHGRMIHSQQERKPTLEIEFHEPIEVSQITLFNRGDLNGCRSRFLTLTASCDSHAVFSYTNYNPETLVSELNDILAEHGGSHDLVDSPNELIEFADTVRAELKDNIEIGNLPWKPVKLAQLLPVFKKNKSISDFQLTVCANILLQLRGNKPYCETARLSPLQGILNTDLSIRKLMDEANRLIGLRATGPATLIAGKHRIQNPILEENRSKYLAALDKIFPLLESMGVKAMICYGTLLGAVREGGFLPHDDDVDVLYVDGSATRADAHIRKSELIARLKQNGYRIWDTGENFHVNIDDAAIDVFPSWQKGDKLTLMMERMQYREIPLSVLLPRSEAKLHDRIYPAPADPEGFLRERYGNDWNISDPFHEWPWPLSRVFVTQKSDKAFLLG